PPLDDLVDGLDPLAHVLALDPVQEAPQLLQQAGVSLEVVVVVVHPVAQHHVLESRPGASPELDGLAVLLAEALQTLSVEVARRFRLGTLRLVGQRRRRGLGNLERASEVQELVRLAEGAEGGEECPHKHGVRVHVVREPLHQLQQRGPLDQGHPSIGLALLKHHVVLRVLQGEP
ncbi:unnamed protein product, partial [Ixodes persulcatus]